MMHQRNRRAALALQQTEIAEQCRNLAGGVFVDGMQADQGVEDEKNGAVKQESGLKPLLVGDAVQAQRIRGDDAKVQASQRKRSEEHTSELQSRLHLVCRLLLEKKNITNIDGKATSISDVSALAAPFTVSGLSAIGSRISAGASVAGWVTSQPPMSYTSESSVTF